jgi:glucose-6-phosphate 1-epimerase
MRAMNFPQRRLMQDLKKQFEIPGIVRVESGNGGLTKIVVSSPKATAEIYLHGAHITHFQPAGHQPVLWMSKSAVFQPGKPIRGGVPICFPWFGPRQGDANAPAHGFIRLLEWQIESITQNNGEVIVTLMRQSDEASKKWWPADFVLRHVVTIGSQLKMTLRMTNRSKEAIRFQEALHTYMNVSDIRQIKVEGLAGAKYIDHLDAKKIKEQNGSVNFVGETDRVYFDNEATCTVIDPVLKSSIKISKSGSKSTVVWNPWIAKAKAMSDFGDDEWPGMLCVETANVHQNEIELAAGATHEMSAILGVL